MEIVVAISLVSLVNLILGAMHNDHQQQGTRKVIPFGMALCVSCQLFNSVIVINNFAVMVMSSG